MGKTTVGIELAKKLNRNFIDSDALLEKKLGMPLWRFAREKGLSEFRHQEGALIQTLMKRTSNKNHVIALGGGFVDWAPSFDTVFQSKNFRIHIEMNPNDLWKRIQEEDKHWVSPLPTKEIFTMLFMERRRKFQALSHNDILCLGKKPVDIDSLLIDD